MKMISRAFPTLVILIICAAQSSAQGQDSPYAIVKPLPEAMEVLPMGAVQAEGWIKEEIEKNLRGYTGHLDSLVPDLILKDDIYGKDRLTRAVKTKDVGAINDGGDMDVQYVWWNSETQSNWWDGYVRSVAALGLKKGTRYQKAQAYIDRILASQDKDGYIGIYDEQMRYKFDKENGELWAQATVLRSLLGWYEFTGDLRVLAVVKRAVLDVMEHYPIEQSHPFYSTVPYVGGLSHGLMMTDVMENLWRLTKNEQYRQYALFLYKDFSEQTLAEDAQYAKVVNDTLRLTGHGVHTYEHLRALAAAYYASGNPALKTALEKYQAKIGRCVTPSGAPIGDEWVGGRRADATNTGYEYCSLHELLHGYADLMAKTGAPLYGDKIERLFFNAAMGARHPTESSIAYLKTDNSYQMTGGLNGDTSNKKQTRYKYSPAHQDAAVCCVPNAGRIFPYYVQHMWMKQGNALVATLLGPSVVRTEVNGKGVTVRQRYGYLEERVVRIDIESPLANAFALKIRKPEWARSVKSNKSMKEVGGYVVFEKTWKGREWIEITFDPILKAHDFGGKEVYYTYGPLVLATPIDVQQDSVTRTFPLAGYRDLAVRPRKPVIPYEIKAGALPEPGPESSHQAFYSGRLKVINPNTGKSETVTLIPMSGTVLRQVTFLKAK